MFSSRGMVSSVILAALVVSLVPCLTGCPAARSPITGGTWRMTADYTQFPGGYPAEPEDWFLTFKRNGTVELTMAGVTAHGRFKVGPGSNAVSIFSPFSVGRQTLLTLSTTLVLEGDTLEGEFDMLYSDALADALEELNGVRVTTAQGTLSGTRSSENKSAGSAGIAEAMQAFADNP